MEDSTVSSCKSVLDIVIAHAKSMVADEVALQLGVQRDVAIIADEFEMIRSFLILMTGDKNQDQGWVKQVRDLAYDVDEGLECFAAKVDQLEKPSRWRIPGILSERRRAALEVKALLARVVDQAFVSKRSLYSRLVKGSAHADAADHATQAVAEQSGIFAAITAIDQARRAAAAGADDSKVDLLRLIDDGVKDLRVIVVWGTSFHLDKTPAVKEAYDGEDASGNTKFGSRAWVKLSCRSGQEDEILRNLVSQLSADGARHQCGFAELEEMVTKILSETRFLIVIDGLCSVANWEWIKTYFPDNKNGSRIIVSTKQVEIASLCMERHYQVSRLASDQHLYLFHYKVKPQADSASTISELSTLGVADEFVFGRIQEKSKLVELICQAHENQECKVISVLGMVGVGKTTLVRSVYEELAALFQNNRAWITVQRPFSFDSCLRSIAGQLYGPNAGREIETVGLEEIIDEIARFLRMQRCLIVLDDLTSSTAEWDLIINNFLDAVIVVTTREYKLARQCSTDRFVLKVEIMQDEDALDLFKRKVFKNDEHYSSSPDLMEEANNIVKKCGGLPLAISVIGSFLSDKPKTRTEWKKLDSKLGIRGPQHTISTILFRSYNELPYYLKSCFLYMAIFPENYNIKRKRLIRLWVAEGYSREMRHLTAEEVGDNYFGELLDRSMIMPVKKVTHSTGKIYSCVLHDLIREICVSESMKEELVFTLEEGRISDTRSKVRQLAISEDWKRDKDQFDLFERTLDLSHVRSLTVFGEWRSFFVTDTMKFVRVLDLENASGLTNHHLNKICQLVHLKYLSLRGCKDISEMPNSLGNLTQLHIMDIRGTNILQLPSTFNKLRKLQQLHASAWFKDEHKVAPSRLNEIEADNSKRRQNKLKLSFSYNKNFNFLGRQASRVVQVPRGIGKLNALRTLGYVRLGQGKGNASLKELEGLTQLCKLELHGVDRTNCRDFWSAITGHSYLKSLSVNRDCVADYLDCGLGGSLSPPKYLENLKLWGRLVGVTKWIQQLQYLSKLQLYHSRLNQDAIEAIGRLPNLRILRLWKSSFKRGELKFVPKSFPCLILLDLRELDTLTVVEFKDGGMPKLERLQAIGLSKLQDFSGLGYLTKLKEIQLGSGYSDNFKENIDSQIAKHSNNSNLKRKPADEQYTLVRDLEP